MEWYLILAVIGVGFVAGFINTVAGSGSLLTLPLLMFLGLPANVANGTNRIAILCQNAVAMISFKQQKIYSFREGFRLAIPAVIGSLIGARIAVNLNDEIMSTTIGGLLIVMFFLVLLKPEKWLKSSVHPPVPFWIQVVIFFFTGLYGGFIQAGVGFFLLAGLVLGSGFELVKANALKVFINFLFTLFALIIFIIHHHVYYNLAFILAIVNIFGAYVAARLAVKWGAVILRYFLIVVLALSSLKLLGVFDLIF